MQHTFGANKLLIGWYSLHAAITPGRLPYAGGVVLLRREHIEAWLADPEGTWDVEVDSPLAAEPQYRPAKFHSSSA